jgi:hypothetical protein
MTDYFTHIAGPMVVYQGRVIQRCMMCGLKLIDSKNMMGPVSDAADGSLTTVATWEAGDIIRVSADSNPTSYFLVGHANQQEPFKDCCIALVEE